ncbi:MAG: hypothetical protein EXS25_06950 [Pedosphaera sp.]|nr:hypothetical protein [Pedosphaera sp.]
MRTLLFFALPREAAAFLICQTAGPVAIRRESVPSEIGNARRYRMGTNEVWVTGMGAVNADLVGRVALEKFRPERVITAGVAGALDPVHQIGDVFHDLDPGMEMEFLLRSAGSRPGQILLRDRIAVTEAEKAALRASTGADLVEMESAVLRELAKGKGIPSATIRSVSDAATGDLPLDFNQFLNGDMRLNPWKLGLGILGRPSSIPALIALGRQTSLATQRLATVLHSVI